MSSEVDAMALRDGMASRIARAAGAACDEGRWTPTDAALRRLRDLERFLPIRIQAGQPELEAMNTRLVDDAVADVLAAAISAMAGGAFARPTAAEISLFGRPPRTAEVVVLPLPLLDAIAA